MPNSSTINTAADLAARNPVGSPIKMARDSNINIGNSNRNFDYKITCLGAGYVGKSNDSDSILLSCA